MISISVDKFNSTAIIQKYNPKNWYTYFFVTYTYQALKK